MANYHINPKTGKISLCKATIKCRYGSPEEHYDSVKEAQEFIEKYENENNKLFATNKKIIHSPLNNVDKLFAYNDHYHSFSGELTDDEYRAMQYYTSHGSAFINDYLNSGKAEDLEQAASFDNFIKGIDSFIEKAPKYEKRVYRGIDADQAVRFLNGEYEIGKVINFKGYVSSTIDPLVALNFHGGDGVILIIDTVEGAPPHTTGVYGGERPQDFEREIILPRNKNYEITRSSLECFKDKDNKIKHVKTYYLKDIN